MCITCLKNNEQICEIKVNRNDLSSGQNKIDDYKQKILIQENILQKLVHLFLGVGD